MDFARKQLEKYGWLEGQGLGKNRDGISKPLKPKLKFDNAGLGHNVCEDFDDPWWQRLYNDAANNIVTGERNGKIFIDSKCDEIDITNRKRKIRSSDDKRKKYKGFIKVSELDGAKETIFGDVETDYQKKKRETQNEAEIFGVTNEELFKICGGRTTHKGARHGLKMQAKLARIMEQERNVIIGAKSETGGDVNNICSYISNEKKKKKNRKNVLEKPREK